MKLDSVVTTLLNNLPSAPGTGHSVGLVVLNPVLNEIVDSDLSNSDSTANPLYERYTRLFSAHISTAKVYRTTNIEVRPELGIRNLLTAVVDALIPREISSSVRPVLLVRLTRFDSGSLSGSISYFELPA